MKTIAATCCAIVFYSLTMPITAYANPGHAKAFWSQLRSYETDAIRDYQSNNITPEVLQLSDRLYDLSLHARLSGSYGTCRKAAQVLSQMVAGNYYSAVSNRVSMDWLAFQGRYIENRSGCLKALELDEREFQLPWWFGR